MWSYQHTTLRVLTLYLTSAVNASGQKLLRINQRKDKVNASKKCRP